MEKMALTWGLSPVDYKKLKRDLNFFSLLYDLA